jgi:hypothetical protein
MEILRIVVILWLFLPLFILIINRYWRAYRLSRYPSAYTAQVVSVSPQSGYMGGNSIVQLTYTYRVMGTDYTAQASLDGKAHKAGGEIPIRYNSDQPAQSIVWKPMPRSEWFFLALVWFSLSLGKAIFAIFISLYILVFTILRLSKLKTSQKAPGTQASVRFIMVVFGIIMVFGIYMLTKDGFLSQNILRSVWNLGGGVNWNTVVNVIEGIVFFFIAAGIGGIFTLLKKKMSPWLAFALVGTIFLAIIFAYINIKIQ